MGYLFNKTHLKSVCDLDLCVVTIGYINNHFDAIIKDATNQIVAKKSTYYTRAKMAHYDLDKSIEFIENRKDTLGDEFIYQDRLDCLYDLKEAFIAYDGKLPNTSDEWAGLEKPLPVRKVSDDYYKNKLLRKQSIANEKLDVIRGRFKEYWDESYSA